MSENGKHKTLVAMLTSGGVATALLVSWGFVIAKAFDELVGTRATYVSVANLYALVGQFVYDTFDLAVQWVWRHPIMFAGVLFSILLLVWVANKIVTREETLPTPVLVTALILVVITLTVDFLYLDLPFVQFKSVIQQRARTDRPFGSTVIGRRTSRLWAQFICAHRDPLRPLAGCSDTPEVAHRNFTNTYLLNVLSAVVLGGATLGLFFLHRRRAAPIVVYSLLGALLFINALALAYVYGKAFRRFAFDRVQLRTSGSEIITGLVLATAQDESGKMLFYEEKEGLVRELGGIENITSYGTDDLLRKHITFSNTPASAPRLPTVPREEQ